MKMLFEGAVLALLLVAGFAALVDLGRGWTSARTRTRPKATGGLRRTLLRS